jgi:hypothetical protein
MTKRQPPKPEPSEPDEDKTSDGPAPWNVEVEFIDLSRKSVMHSIYGASLDAERVYLLLEDGKHIVYPHDIVRKVLMMHSSKYDGYVESKPPNGEEVSE